MTTTLILVPLHAGYSQEDGQDVAYVTFMDKRDVDAAQDIIERVGRDGLCMEAMRPKA
jgi:hypothetical protein